MEIKRVFRALRYRPKHLLQTKKAQVRQRIVLFMVGFAIVGMVVGGLWLVKVVERNINNAINQQIDLVSPEVAPAGRPTNFSTQRSTSRGDQSRTEGLFEPELLIRPVEFTEVVRKIGWLKHPRFGYWFYHDGFDVLVASNAIIRAVAPGTVTEIIRDYDEEGLGISGNRITVSHGQDGQSRYIFSGRVEVSLGQTISAGTALGVVAGEPGTDKLVHIGMVWEDKDFDWLAVLENRG